MKRLRDSSSSDSSDDNAAAAAAAVPLSAFEALPSEMLNEILQRLDPYELSIVDRVSKCASRAVRAHATTRRSPMAHTRDWPVCAACACRSVSDVISAAHFCNTQLTKEHATIAARNGNLAVCAMFVATGIVRWDHRLFAYIVESGNIAAVEEAIVHYHCDYFADSALVAALTAPFARAEDTWVYVVDLVHLIDLDLDREAVPDYIAQDSILTGTELVKLFELAMEIYDHYGLDGCVSAAIERGEYELADHILAQYGKNSPVTINHETIFADACARDDTACASFLMKHGHANDIKGVTLAAQANAIGILRARLTANPSLDTSSVYVEALRQDRADVMQVLFECGCPVAAIPDLPSAFAQFTLSQVAIGAGSRDPSRGYKKRVQTMKRMVAILTRHGVVLSRKHLTVFSSPCI